jgi:hypothetical protein
MHIEIEVQTLSILLIYFKSEILTIKKLIFLVACLKSQN